MKFSIRTSAILAAAITIYSCNNAGTDSTNSTDSTSRDNTKVSADAMHTVGDTSHSIVSNTTASSAEQDFINFAVPANTKEILWLKAGLSKGAGNIKEHSSMMLKDHNKLDETVKGWLAKHPDIKIPIVDTANTVDINNKTGNDWNKAWVDKMVKDHNGLLEQLKKSQSAVKDSSLSKIITSTIPVVESHIAMTKMMEQKHSK